MISLMAKTVLFSTVLLLQCSLASPLALTSQAQPKEGTSRRDLLASLATTVVVPSVLLLTPASAHAAANEDSSVFLGTYTDPVNHPGGFRKVELTGSGFGGYELAKVLGGGGKGEPESYELPAMIFPCPGNRQGMNRPSSGQYCITIDFSPKGGPKDFTGYWDQDQKGIRFILDDNFWPKKS